MIKNILFFSLLLIFTVGCKKKPTTWQSNWQVPILKDTLSFKNFINAGQVSVASDESLTLTYQREILSFNISDYVNLPDTSVTQNFQIPVQNLSVSPGANFVNDVEEFNFEIGEVELKTVLLSNGKAKVRIENPIATATNFTINLLGVTKDGVEFTQTETVPQGTITNPGVKNFELDLKGYVLDLTGENGNSFNKLRSVMQVKTDPNGPTLNVSNADVFKFVISMENLSVDYARGYFGNIVLEEDEEINVEELNGIVSGAVDLNNVDINLTVNNGIKVAGKAKITALKSIGNTNEVILNHSDINVFKNVDPCSGDYNSISPSVINYNFTSSNSNIEEFLENLGSKYSVGYKVEINPFGNSSGGFDEVFPNSKLSINLDANIPLGVGVDELTFVDTFSVNLFQNQDKTHVKSGDLILKVNNSFPFKGSVVIDCLDENKTVLSTLSSNNEISNAYNITSLTTEIVGEDSELTYSISEDEMIKINNTKYIKVTAVLDSESNDIQTLYSTSQLIMNLYTKFTLENKY